MRAPPLISWAGVAARAFVRSGWVERAIDVPGREVAGRLAAVAGVSVASIVGVVVGVIVVVASMAVSGPTEAAGTGGGRGRREELPPPRARGSPTRTGEATPPAGRDLPWAAGAPRVREGRAPPGARPGDIR
jgi:hypothetical protein